MQKNIIDIVDIKKAVTNGEIFFYVKRGFSDKGTVQYIYCKNDCGECVKVGEVEEVNADGDSDNP